MEQKQCADCVNTAPHGRNLCWRCTNLKCRYGINRKIYVQMLDKQDGKCAICHEIKPEKLVIDHDHTNGNVRGLLCPGCNYFLGMVETKGNDILFRLCHYRKSYLTQHGDAISLNIHQLNELQTKFDDNNLTHL